MSRCRVLTAIGLAVAVCWAVELIEIFSLDTVTLQGSVFVAARAPSRDPCTSADQPKVHTGTVMLLTSPDGQTIGVAQLRIGHPAQHGAECRYRFTFRGVAQGFKAYDIEIGRGPKVAVSSSRFREGLNVYLG